ncbi:MAG: hypothetical protein HY675_09865 [Chloroflexi bacterium]|nr:hypothetical protein [Chloroflexota bacterium]
MQDRENEVQDNLGILEVEMTLSLFSLVVIAALILAALSLLPGRGFRFPLVTVAVVLLAVALLLQGG